MILKKVESNWKRKTFSQWARHRNVPSYILNPAKCTYSGTRNLLASANDPIRISVEMFSVSRRSRSKDPSDHLIFSFQNGENPTNEQVDQMVDLAMARFKTQHCLALFGVHRDTENTHVHLYLSRHDPVAGRTVKINAGFDRKARQMAVAEIEYEQGWTSQVRNLYQVDSANPVDENGELRLIELRPHDPAAPPVPAALPGKIADREVRKGVESAISLAQRVAFAIIRDASSWDDLHEKLSTKGMFVRQPPGLKGGQLMIGEQPIKLSQIAKRFSMSNLEKRFGQFQAPTEAQIARAQSTEPPRKWTLEEKAQHAAAKAEQKAERAAEFARYTAMRKAYTIGQNLTYSVLRKSIIDEPRHLLVLSQNWVQQSRPIYESLLTHEERELFRAFEEFFRMLGKLLLGSPERELARQERQRARDAKSDRLLELSLINSIRPRFPSLHDWKIGNPPSRSDLPREMQEQVKVLLMGPASARFRQDSKMLLDQIRQHRKNVAEAREAAKQIRQRQDQELETARESAKTIEDPKLRSAALAKVRDQKQSLYENRLSPEARAERIKARIERLEDEAHRIAHAQREAARDVAKPAQPIANPQVSAQVIITQPIAPAVPVIEAETEQPQTAPVTPAAVPQQTAITPAPAATQPPIATTPAKVKDDAPRQELESVDFRNRLERIERENWEIDRASIAADDIAREAVRCAKDAAYLKSQEDLIEARIAAMAEFLATLPIESLPQSTPTPISKPSDSGAEEQKLLEDEHREERREAERAVNTATPPASTSVKQPTPTPTAPAAPATPPKIAPIITEKYGSELLREMDEIGAAQRLDEERDRLARAEAERAAAATVQPEIKRMIQNATATRDDNWWQLKDADKRADIKLITSELDSSQSLVAFGRYPHKAMIVVSVRLILHRLPERLHDAMVLEIDDNGKAVSVIQRMTIKEEIFQDMSRKAAQATTARERESRLRLNTTDTPTTTQTPKKRGR